MSVCLSLSRVSLSKELANDLAISSDSDTEDQVSLHTYAYLLETLQCGGGV